jgi:Mn2+/Fe2+ NRAMP family transporter
MFIAPLGVKKFPKPISLRKLIGPSFIILGVGLGSGELILWPYLSANFGMGLIWAAILGISFQFFLNMEIERYTLVRGESIFVGLSRKFGKGIPFWFILSTFVPWMWPGIAASSALLIASAFGVPYNKWIGIFLLLAIGIILSLGKIVYKTQEKVQMAIILIGIPFIFITTLIFLQPGDIADLAAGAVGLGENFWFIPVSVPIATFLAAFAYSGAGGNLNLAQSLYAREKGYGMGKYSNKITNVFSGVSKKYKLEGNKFDLTDTNINRYNIWWKRINIEHALVFWLTGSLTMIMLSLLAYTTVYGTTGVESSINFLVNEGKVIGEKTMPLLGTMFLLMGSLMLFGTQLSVFGSNARIMSENLSLTSVKFPARNLSKYFYIFLWIQILAGVAIFASGFTEPLTLVVIGAVFNAISMFVYSGLVLWLNKSLPNPLKPGLFRTLAVGTAFVFYGAFTFFVVMDRVL